FDAVEWPAPGPARFACVGRLDAMSKGYDTLIEALGGLAWRDRAWILSMYGDGPDRPYLQELSAVYGVGDKVIFRGHVNDVTRIWAENELLVLPSRTEGTPLSLIEALVCGRPAVVTDVGDCARWAQDGQTGFVAEGSTAVSIG